MKNKKLNLTLWIMVAAVLIAGCSSLPAQSEPTAEPEPIDDFVPLVSATGEVVPFQSSTLSVSAQVIVE